MKNVVTIQQVARLWAAGCSLSLGVLMIGCDPDPINLAGLDSGVGGSRVTSSVVPVTRAGSGGEGAEDDESEAPLTVGGATGADGDGSAGGGEAGDAGLATPDSGGCEEGERRCAPQLKGVVESCDAGGRWQLVAQCDGEAPSCFEGDCVACEAGTSSCDASGVLSCGSDGQWVQKEACQPGTYCVDGEFICRACEDDERQCLDHNTLGVCADAEFVAEPCGGEQPYCVDGQCQACHPSESKAYCSEGKPTRCEGGHWQVGAPCGGDTPVCSETLGGCVACEEGGARCGADGTRELCDGLGRWQPAPCSGAFSECLAGECVECEPSQAPPLCREGARHECNAAGAYELVQRCEGNTPVCLTNLGECGACSEGEQQCSNDHTAVETCNASGQFQSAACSGSKPVCDAAQCVECSASSGVVASCAGATPLLCAAGKWVAQAPCSGDTPSCDAGTGSCVCREGDFRCQGPGGARLERCELGRWVAQATCTGSAPICDASGGACVCNNGDYRCTDAQLLQCAAGAWLEKTRCSGLISRCDAALAQCVCPDGTLKCTEPPPAIAGFSSNKTSLPGGGGAITLSWSVTDASALFVEADVGGDLGVVTGTSVSVTAAQTTTYTLVATSGGGEARKSLVVEVSASGELDSWAVRSGTSDQENPAALAFDAQGGLVVVGWTDAAFPGPRIAQTLGATDLFLHRYSNTGTRTLALQFGTQASDLAAALAIDGEGAIWVAGYTYGAFEGSNRGGSDALLAKYSSKGVQQKRIQLGSNKDDKATGVAVGADNSVYVSGWTEGAVTGTSFGARDIFLAQYTSAGTELWRKQLGSADYDEGRAIAVNDSGTVFVGGSTTGALSASKPPNYQAVLAIYSKDGAAQKVLQFGPSSGAGISALAIDSQGNAVVAGSTSGTLGTVGAPAGGSDIFVAKYTPSGTQLWSHQFGTPQDDTAYGVALDSLDNVFVVGSTAGAFDGGAVGGVFVAKLTADGQSVAWIRQPRGDLSDFAVAVAADPFGYVAVTGHAYGVLTQSDPNQSSSKDDLVVLRYR